MNFYDSELLLENNDISYRLFIRIAYFYFLLSIVIIQSLLYYFMKNEIDYYNNYPFIYSYNISLMISINLGYIFLFFFACINFSLFFNRTIVRCLYLFFNFTDIVLKTFGTIINTFVLLEPEFQFITFYLWNIFLIMNIYSNYTIYKLHKRKNKMPGKNNISLNTCPICLDNNSNWILPCNHQYHYICFKEWYNINKSCPYCRRNFNT